MDNGAKKIKKAANIRIHRTILFLAYVYLILPMIIFLLGWCRPVVGVPMAGICIWSLFLCIRKRENYIALDWKLTQADKWKIVVIVAVIFAWVALSGIGGYAWQNTDHLYRNATFYALINHKWPPVSGNRGLTYYIGTWLPAALIGKQWGTEAGETALFIWLLVGICLLYALVCVWRRKIVLWPLTILIFFSGLDIIGSYLFSDNAIHIFGSDHLEWWAYLLQYSSNTSQLYWVFNQAIPVWLAVMLLFMDEPPQNMIWLCTAIAITSTLPFIGIIPIMIYYLFKRSEWEKVVSVRQGWRMVFKNMGSIQNLAGGGSVLVLAFLYLMGNDTFTVISTTASKEGAVRPAYLAIWFPWLFLLAAALAILLFASLLIWLIKWEKGYILRNMLYAIAALVLMILFFRDLGTDRTGENDIYRLAYTVIFLMLEAGIYLYLLFKDVEDKGLFNVVAVSLLIIPFIKIGYSNDFCMRASIPALFITMLWCIEALGKKRMNFRIIALLVCLVIGSVTPIHEIRRALMNSHTEYAVESVAEEKIFNTANFSGSLDTFFWKYIAKKNIE